MDILHFCLISLYDLLVVVEYEHLSLRVNAAFEIMMIIIMVTKD